MANFEDGLQVRIGDAERDRAVEVLKQASVDGRLTAAELDDRVGRALAGRTRADLLVLLEDVMPQVLLRDLLAGGVPEPLGAGYRWDDPLIITARWEDERRIGRWLAPPFIEAHPSMSNIKLNFIDATVGAPVIDLVLMGGAGNVVVVLPLGWGADVTRVTKGMGSVRSLVDARPGPGGTMLMIRGRVTLGNLRVRHPNRFDAWQLQRVRVKTAGQRALPR